MRRRSIQAILIALGGVAIWQGVTQGRENSEGLIFVQNLMWSVMGGVIGTIYLFLLRGAKDVKTRSLMLGIMFTSFAVFFHRGWFAAFRYTKAAGLEPQSQWLLDNAWMLFVPISMALVGYAHHARPLLEARLGEWWLTWYIFAAIVIWATIVSLVPV